jgi:hypothetical protein
MARRKNRSGLILLSPQPGNYQSIVSEDFPLEFGDLIEFHCPVCSVSLTADENDNLATLVYRFSPGREGTVFFSRRFGEHATYLVFNNEVQTFGENALPNSHMNFFGSGHVED